MRYMHTSTSARDGDGLSRPIHNCWSTLELSDYELISLIGYRRRWKYKGWTCIVKVYSNDETAITGDTYKPRKRPRTAAHTTIYRREHTGRRPHKPTGAQLLSADWVRATHHLCCCCCCWFVSPLPTLNAPPHVCSLSWLRPPTLPHSLHSLSSYPSYLPFQVHKVNCMIPVTQFVGSTRNLSRTWLQNPFRSWWYWPRWLTWHLINELHMKALFHWTWKW